MSSKRLVAICPSVYAMRAAHLLFISTMLILRPLPAQAPGAEAPSRIRRDSAIARVIAVGLVQELRYQIANAAFDTTYHAADLQFPDSEAPAAWNAVRRQLLAITHSRAVTSPNTSAWSINVGDAHRTADPLRVTFTIGMRWACPEIVAGSGTTYELTAKRVHNGPWLDPVVRPVSESDGMSCLAAREWAQPRGLLFEVARRVADTVIIEPLGVRLVVPAVWLGRIPVGLSITNRGGRSGCLLMATSPPEDRVIVDPSRLRAMRVGILGGRRTSQNALDTALMAFTMVAHVGGERFGSSCVTPQVHIYVGDTSGGHIGAAGSVAQQVMERDYSRVSLVQSDSAGWHISRISLMDSKTDWIHPVTLDIWSRQFGGRLLVLGVMDAWAGREDTNELMASIAVQFRAPVDTLAIVVSLFRGLLAGSNPGTSSYHGARLAVDSAAAPLQSLVARASSALGLALLRPRTDTEDYYAAHLSLDSFSIHGDTVDVSASLGQCAADYRPGQMNSWRHTEHDTSLLEFRGWSKKDSGFADGSCKPFGGPH